MNSKEFGRLLTQAVRRIAFLREQSVFWVQEMLGDALGRETGKSAVEYWRKGHIPRKASDVAALAREIARGSDVDRPWMEAFLRAAGYAEARALCDELFPDGAGRRGLALELAGPRGPRPVPVPAPADELAPFVVGPPILECRQFFGREQELGRIFGAIGRLPMQHVAVVGRQRTGKTSLLRYVHQVTSTPPAALRPGQRSAWLREPGRYRWVFVDFQDLRMQRQESLLRHLLTELGLPVPGPCTLQRFMDTVSEELPGPTVVLLDEIGAALEAEELDTRFWNSLRSLATVQTGGRLAFILAAQQAPDQEAQDYGKQSPFFNIFWRLDLGPLSEDAARELIGSAPQPFAPEDVEWILAQSRRWPSLLQILCRSRLTSLEQGEADGTRWQEEGLRQIQRFSYLLRAT